MKTEVYEARVTSLNPDDPPGCIRVACQGLLSDEDSELPMAIPPLFDWGWFLIPDPGETVEIEVRNSGTKSKLGSSVLGLDIHWRGKRYYTGDSTEAETEVRQVHEDFTKKNYGKRRGFATPQGHIIYFDDTEGDKKIQVTWKDGEKFQFISFDNDGALISNQNGTFIQLDAENEEMKIIDQHGSSISSNEDGIKMIDKFKNIIEMKDGAIQIVSQDGIVATGKDFTAATGTVNLVDGADDFLVRGADLIAWLMGHVHPTGMGPSGPPTPGIPSLPTDFLSTVAKVK